MADSPHLLPKERLEAMRRRASCVDLATSVDDYHKLWREFERHAIEDMNALLDEVARLRGEINRLAACECGRPLSVGLCGVCDNDE